MNKWTFNGVRRNLYKRVATADGRGVTSEPDGQEVAEIEVTIDIAEIARRYGVQAMCNKSGTSKYLSGLVVAKVLSRRPA